MAITIEKQFSVDAPISTVWDFLTDPHKVAACLPGASITEQVDERTFRGKIDLKVGPVSSSYKGKITFERLDQDAGFAELTGRGQDVRGRGGADMKMTSRLVEHDGTTDVNVASEVTVTGILAQFGRGMIQDVSDQIFQTFTDRMRAELEPAMAGAVTDASAPSVGSAATSPPAARESLDVVALGTSVAGRAMGRLLRRPVFWVAVVVLAIIIYVLVR